MANYQVDQFNVIGMGGLDYTGVTANDRRSPPETMKIYAIKDSLLEKKSFLQFEYPQETDPTAAPRMIRLPFYEDPEIRESKAANYASYKPLSRASELFAYLGSDARQFSLTFTLTLPHLVNLLNTTRNTPLATGSLQDRKKFFNTAEYTDRDNNTIGPRSDDYIDAFSPIPKDSENTADLIQNELGFPLTQEGYEAWFDSRPSIYREKGKAARDLLVYWIDVIRSAAYNNVQNPVFGPPMIRLTHGILYRNIPCILTNYSITFDPNTGYDKDTLIPRVLKIDMELKEVRAGDFGKFDATEVNSVKGENLAGWEAVVTNTDNQIGGSIDVVPTLPKAF